MSTESKMNEKNKAKIHDLYSTPLMLSESDITMDFLTKDLKIKPFAATKLFILFNKMKTDLALKDLAIAQLKTRIYSKEATLPLNNNNNNNYMMTDYDEDCTNLEINQDVNADMIFRSPSASITPPSSYNTPIQITPSYEISANRDPPTLQCPPHPISSVSDACDTNNNNNPHPEIVSFSLNMPVTFAPSPPPPEVSVCTSKHITDYNPEQDDIIFQHRIARGWRWDFHSKVWRVRGEGLVSIYYIKSKQLAKIVFRDERKNKTRMLQYIKPNGNEYAECWSKKGAEENEYITWFAEDYVINQQKPLRSTWKIQFETVQLALEFRNIYNWFVDAPNKIITLNDYKTITNQDQRDLVTGYINNIQLNTTNDIIPSIIYHWCLLYSHDPLHRFPFKKHDPSTLPAFSLAAMNAKDMSFKEMEAFFAGDIDINTNDPLTAATPSPPPPEHPTTVVRATPSAALQLADLAPSHEELFRQKIEIPDDKKESQKFVGKPINFDEVKLINQKLKNKVCGYIREAQGLFPWKKNIFRTIPQQVYHWCILYVHDSFPNMVRDVYHDNIHISLGSVRAFRKLLSSPDRPPIQQVIDSGVVPRFVNLLQNHSYPQLQYESLWALLNIASGPKECVAHVIQHKSHQMFIKLLADSPYYEVKEQAMWALGNIAGDGQELKDFLMMNPNMMINTLMICGAQFNPRGVTNFTNNDMIKKYPVYQYVSLLSTTSWALSNFCRGSPPMSMTQFDMIIQCIRCLMTTALKFRAMSDEELVGPDHPETKLKQQDGVDRIREHVNEVCSNIAWATSYLTSHDYGFVGYNGIAHLLGRMFKNNTVAEFINLMDCEDPNIRHACNRVSGNILTGSDTDAHKCIQLGVLNKYYNVLEEIIKPQEQLQEMEAKMKAKMMKDHVKDKDDTKVDPKLAKLQREKKEISWALSNILAGPVGDRLLVLEANLFPIMCDYLINAPYDVAKEALWCISNASSSRHKDIINGFMNKFDVLTALTKFLNKYTGNKLDHRMKIVAFEAINNILLFGAEQKISYRSKFETSGLLGYLHQVSSDPSAEDDIMDKADEFIQKYFSFDAESQKEQEQQQQQQIPLQPNEETKEDINDNDNDDQDQDNDTNIIDTAGLVIDLEEDKKEMHIKEQLNMHGIELNDDDNESQHDDEYDEPIEF